MQQQFAQVGLMTAYHNYIVTSLDLHLVELEDFKYSGTNITAFRLVNPDLHEVQKARKLKQSLKSTLSYCSYKYVVSNGFNRC